MIKQKFEQLKNQSKKAFIPYLTYGFPDQKTFEEIVLAVADTGVDFIEIGMPFSDPIADGPVIQKSSQVALAAGASLPQLLESLKKLRAKVDVPFLVMSYYNPIFHMGVDTFCVKAQGVIDGLVIPDLLPEEAKELILAAKKHNIATVFFIAPTTPISRYKLIDNVSTGFIYFVSVTGTTGERNKFDKNILQTIKTVKKNVKTPVCVGFGISTAEQVKTFSNVSDGVIVGSAIIKFIQENYGQSNFINQFKNYIKGLQNK